MTIKDTIIEYAQKHPHADYEQICKVIRKKFPKSKTTPASVASTLSRQRNAIKRGETVPPSGDEVTSFQEENPDETLEEAMDRIALRYEAMERMAQLLVKGKIPSLIISGPPGMSKSWTIDASLKNSGRNRHDGMSDVGGGAPDPENGIVGWYDKISGSASAVGLFHALWNMRNGGVVYLDDCDAVFRDEDTLNMLKVATDSTRERLISWRKNSAWLEEYGMDRTFEFNGHLVFLTNIDFEQIILKGHRDSEHFKALIDRARYLCLTLRTRRDFMIRIRMVADGPTGMLAKYFGLSNAQIAEVLDFVDENQDRFYNLSLRLVGQIAVDMLNNPNSWQRDTVATKMRTY